MRLGGFLTLSPAHIVVLAVLMAALWFTAGFIVGMGYAPGKGAETPQTAVNLQGLVKPECLK
jgi:hypothetical protein